MRSAVVVGSLAALRCTVVCLAIAACASDRATQPQDGAQNSVLIAHIFTDGHDPDSDGYRLGIGAREYPVEDNDTLVVTDLPPAAYPLSVADVALNCNPSSGNVSVIQVTADTSVATVAVHCGATLNGRLVFSTTVMGTGRSTLFDSMAPIR